MRRCCHDRRSQDVLCHVPHNISVCCRNWNKARCFLLSLRLDVLPELLFAHIADARAEVSPCPQQMLLPEEPLQMVMMELPHVVGGYLLEGMYYAGDAVERCCRDEEMHMVIVRLDKENPPFVLHVLSPVE